MASLKHLLRKAEKRLSEQDTIIFQERDGRLKAEGKVAELSGKINEASMRVKSLISRLEELEGL